MSLKTFHIVFIVLSILLSFGVSYWGFSQYNLSKGLTEAGLGVGFFLVGGLLIFYLIHILKKLKSL